MKAPKPNKKLFINQKIQAMKVKQSRSTAAMRLSWQIQKAGNTDRKRALAYAWGMVLCENIMVHRLVQKHSHTNYPNKVRPETLSLF